MRRKYKDIRNKTSNTKSLFKSPFTQSKTINLITIPLFIIGSLLFFSAFFGSSTSFARAPIGIALIFFAISIRFAATFFAITKTQKSIFNLISDPDQARRDLEPYARMRGDLLKDTLDEIGLDLEKITDNLTSNLSPNTPDTPDFDQKLRKIHQLHSDDILTDEEYHSEKQEILKNN